MTWLAYALIGALCIAIHQFSLTKLAKLNLPISFINAIVYGVTAIILVGICLFEAEFKKVTFNHIIWITSAVISVVGVIICTLKALNLSSNPGYVGAILSMSAVFLTGLSVLFLKSSLSIVKIVGISLAISGAILLGL